MITIPSARKAKNPIGVTDAIAITSASQPARQAAVPQNGERDAEIEDELPDPEREEEVAVERVDRLGGSSRQIVGSIGKRERERREERQPDHLHHSTEQGDGRQSALVAVATPEGLAQRAEEEEIGPARE